MKLKRLLSSILLLTITVGLFSCSKDETTPEKESIVGKWELTSLFYSFSEDGKVVEEETTDYTNYPKKPTIEFKADGTGLNVDYDNDAESSAFEDPFTYVVKEDVVVVTTEDFETRFKFVVDNNTIKLESEEKDGSMVEKNVVSGKRVK